MSLVGLGLYLGGQAARNVLRLAVRTGPGRRLLELAALADEEAGFALLERLALRFNARLEIRD